MSGHPCKYCQSRNTVIHQTRRNDSGTVFRRKCRNCNRTFTVSEDGTYTAPAGEPEKMPIGPSFEESGNEAIACLPRQGIPPTIEDLFVKFEIKAEDWNIVSFKINEWQQHSDKHGVVSLYQGKATLMRKCPTICEWPAVQPVNITPLPMARSKEPKGDIKRAIVCADSQIGFFRDFETFQVGTLHDLPTFSLWTQAIIELKPDVLVLGGDMLDLPDWSDHFIVTPEFYTSTQLAINWFASWVQSIRPYCGRVVYLAGNHEVRLIRSIVKNTASAYRLKPANLPDAPPLLSIESMLGLEALDVEYISDYPAGEFWINRDLKVIHGHKIGARSGQTVMKMLDGARCSVIQGHVHRQESAHITVRSHNKTITYGAHSLGCGARIDGVVPGTSGQENWQQGFAVVDYTDDLFQVNQININDGKMVMFGRQYDSVGVSNSPLTDEQVRRIRNGAADLPDPVMS